MKIAVDVIRAEQVWDADSGTFQGYLVFRFAGLETRVPCDEEHLAAAIQEIEAARRIPQPRVAPPQPAAPEERTFSYGNFVQAQEHEPEPELTAEPPAIFQAPEATVERRVSVQVEMPRRTLAPVSRPRVKSDDAGIAQG